MSILREQFYQNLKAFHKSAALKKEESELLSFMEKELKDIKNFEGKIDKKFIDLVSKAKEDFSAVKDKLTDMYTEKKELLDSYQISPEEGEADPNQAKGRSKTKDMVSLRQKINELIKHYTDILESMNAVINLEPSMKFLYQEIDNLVTHIPNMHSN